LLTSNGTVNAAVAEPNLTYDGNTFTIGAITGATGTTLQVLGSSGELLKVTDTLTGMIYQIGDISGTPIFQVNSNGAIYISTISLPGLTSTGSPHSGVTFDKTTGTACYFDYRVSDSGSGAYRAGTVMSVWDGTNVSYTDTSTTDLVASTADIEFTVGISGSNLILYVNITSGTWALKVGARII